MARGEPVIFRVWPDGGDVIALFPELPADPMGKTCLSYLHLGQHGPADPSYAMRITRPASPSQYRDLAAELRQIGYKLSIIKRIRKDHRYTRMYRAALGG